MSASPELLLGQHQVGSDISMQSSAWELFRTLCPCHLQKAQKTGKARARGPGVAGTSQVGSPQGWHREERGIGGGRDSREESSSEGRCRQEAH